MLSISDYNKNQSSDDQLICDLLTNLINKFLSNSTSKIWHAHPVWFINENPIVGYSKQKKGIRLMFWSGADFEEEKLNVIGSNFKDASIFYIDVTEINEKELKRWLTKSIKIQWDYKNIVKRMGFFFALAVVLYFLSFLWQGLDNKYLRLILNNLLVVLFVYLFCKLELPQIRTFKKNSQILL